MIFFQELWGYVSGLLSSGVSLSPKSFAFRKLNFKSVRAVRAPWSNNIHNQNLIVYYQSINSHLSILSVRILSTYVRHIMNHVFLLKVCIILKLLHTRKSETNPIRKSSIFRDSKKTQTWIDALPTLTRHESCSRRISSFTTPVDLSRSFEILLSIFKTTTHHKKCIAFA